MINLRKALDDPGVARVLAVLDCAGEEARVIGGAVRDLVLGRAPGDFDIATTALPPEVIRRAGEAGIKAVPTGIDHGTVTLVIEGRPFEVTTLRRDVETDGRHAVVAFGRDWAEDAQRRDFTFNALSLDRHGQVHDTTGGLADLAAGQVRFIGDPRLRIREDYLRSLRFFRFHASYGQGNLDREGFDAVVAERAGLAQLSAERVRVEIFKLLLAGGGVETVAVMAGAGILGRLLGGVPRIARLRRMVEVERQAGLAPDAVRRLGALNVATIEEADRLRERLRLSNRDYTALRESADGVPIISPDLDAASLRRLSYRLGSPVFRALVLSGWASGRGHHDEDWLSLWRFAQMHEAPRLPWSGADLLARGFRGTGVGEALRELEELWISADFPSRESDLSRIFESVAERPR
jgi:poly(A) polymerase